MLFQHPNQTNSKQNDFLGNIQKNEMIFKFHIDGDSVGPLLTETWPIQGLQVGLGHPIWLRFSEVVQMGTEVKVNAVLSSHDKPTTVEFRQGINDHLWEFDGRDLVFKLDPLIGAGEIYKLTVPIGGVVDRVGLPMLQPAVLTWQTEVGLFFFDYLFIFQGKNAQMVCFIIVLYKIYD